MSSTPQTKTRKQAPRPDIAATANTKREGAPLLSHLAGGRNQNYPKGRPVPSALPQDDPHEAEDEGKRPERLVHGGRDLFVRVRRSLHPEEVGVQREHEQERQDGRGRPCSTRRSWEEEEEEEGGRGGGAGNTWRPCLVTRFRSETVGQLRMYVGNPVFCM